MKYVKPVLLVLFLCGTIFASESTSIPQPVLDGDAIANPTFGDARNIELFAGLLADEDVRVRERAAVELGQTHNPAALVQLRRAMRDSSPVVRAAAIRGATELGTDADVIILSGLRDKDEAPLTEALQAAVSLNLQNAVDAIQSLTRHERDVIRYSALRALTALQQPARADDLKPLLSDPSPAVRVEALNNALLLKSARELSGEFLRLADSHQPAVAQAAAIECLGAFVLNTAPEKPQPTTAPTTAPTSAPAPVKQSSDPWTGLVDYAEAGQAENPLLRRAVVRVYQRHGMVKKVLPFLSDPSPLVRLAATRAMVDLPNPQAIKPLMKLFLATPDEETHTFARQALQNIGGSPVGASAAESLSRIMADLDAVKITQSDLGKKLGKILDASGAKEPDPKAAKEVDELRTQLDTHRRKFEQLQRNAMSCCYLLGVLKRKEGFDQLLKLTSSLSLDSPILGEVAVALGRIGDARAITPLKQVLDHCSEQALPYLKAMTSMSAPPPFSEKNTGLVIQALVLLGDKSSTDTILRLTRLNVMSMNLGTVIGYVLEAVPDMVTEKTQADIEKFILFSLVNRNLSPLVQWRAAKLAGLMKLPKALPALKKILYQDRKCPSLMAISAWAIQQITGSETPPKMPQPMVRQGDWIITQIE